ncbi:type II toxin-antitoxin system RelE/ParE family toxin [Erwinia phyllosphaerae]|uniref:type II toxin-antitoxin system RelE/ParE family toxin n=1 Tax=Erwinia phyllosphaerae TaxID=2853256 RepID=UPI001FEFB1FB|nr:type II toxin-antitoxin system RelE/ParE family toxin [Erwinia phyllosphaerae]MBV4367676.1 type II toxin-antitoxin system RelE/ParE family toxin [Erwinia phyllosphaerae]
MARIVFTDDAREDLREIKDYSIRTWGKAIAKNYLLSLQVALKLLAENPGIGHDEQENLWPEVFSFPCASHMIYYTAIKGGVLVIAVIPQSRLPKVLLQRKGA